MNLDVATLRISGAMIGIVMSLLSLLLWLTGKMYAGFGRWTLAKAVGALATLLTLAWAQPSWPLGITGAVFGICAVTLNLEACREFLGWRPIDSWIWGFLIAFSAAGLLVLQFGSPADLIRLSLVGGGIVYGWTGLILFQSWPWRYQAGRTLTALCFSFLGFTYLANGLDQWISGQSVLAPAPFSLANGLASIVLNFGFFLMHYQRLLTQREQELAHSESANRELGNLKEHLEDTVRVRTAELIQAQKLESVGRLAAGVAHDFNNLLTVINGHADLLLRGLPKDDAVRPGVDEIRQAGQSAAELTRQLLAFSRKQMLVPHVLDLNALVETNVTLLGRILGEDIEIAVRLDPTLQPVEVDPVQIGQVIMNLAVNARDAMPQGGVLRLETERIFLDEASAASLSLAPGDYAALTIKDSGSGMDPRTLSKIFEPFFTTKELGKGTGLGLSTVYGIVSQSGGSISVSSEPGRGSAFKIYLPRSERAVSEPGQASAAQPVAGSETILLVEDDQSVRNIISSGLRSFGYNVIEAHGGKEALEAVRTCGMPIQLLISDVVMPRMSGQELAERLRARQTDLPVLFISGYSDELARSQLRNSSKFLLQKPFTPFTLAQKVREILQANVSGEGKDDGVLPRTGSPAGAPRTRPAD